MTIPPIDPFDSEVLLASYIGRYAQEASLVKIIPSQIQVLLYGEEHSREITKQLFIETLPAFRQLGFTHLGLEMISTNLQPEVTTYQTSDNHRKIINEHILNRFGNYSPHAQELYMKILTTASDCGFQLVALEMPDVEAGKYKETIELEHARDRWMLRHVKQVVDRGARLISYSGNAHASLASTSLGGLLKQENYHCLTVGTAGGSLAHISTIEKAAIKAKKQFQSFLLPVRIQVPNAVTPYDWILHLPQKEELTAGEAFIQPHMGFGKAIRWRSIR